MIESDRAIAERLRALRTIGAPPQLVPAVLLRSGLADGYTSVISALGPVFVAYNDRGISLLRRAASAAVFERALRAELGRRAVAVASLPPELQRFVRRRLAGERVAGPLDLRSRTDFERAVLEQAAQIPSGEVRPYQWIARRIGRPLAVRAVGTALARNPVPLLVPCHRVVRTDGRIGDYIFGSTSKARLLREEGVDVPELNALARTGSRFWGSTRTKIYCYPTCRDARRITPARRVSFVSSARAEAAGYRGCKHCQPAALPVAASERTPSRTPRRAAPG